MARPLRIAFPGVFYHITVQGKGQSVIPLCSRSLVIDSALVILPWPNPILGF